MTLILGSAETLLDRDLAPDDRQALLEIVERHVADLERSAAMLQEHDGGPLAQLSNAISSTACLAVDALRRGDGLASADVLTVLRALIEQGADDLHRVVRDPTAGSEHTATDEWKRSLPPLRFVDTLVDDFVLSDFSTELASEVGRVLEAAEVAVFLAGANGGLEVSAASSARMLALALHELNVDDGPSLQCYRSGAPLRSVELAGQWGGLAEKARAIGYRRVHALPLTNRQGSLGVVAVFETSARPLDPARLAPVHAIVGAAAIGISNRRLLDRAHEVAQLLRQSIDGRVALEQATGIVAERFGMAADDAYEWLRSTGKHTNTRVEHIAEAVVSGVGSTSKPSAPDPDWAEFVPVPMLRLRRHSGVVATNRLWSILTGQRPSEARGDGWLQVLGPRSRREAQALTNDGAGGAPSGGYSWQIGPPGDGAKWVEARVGPDFSDDLEGFVIAMVETTDQHHARARLAYQATHDPLTGLPRRDVLVGRITHALARISRHAATLAVLFIDIDHLKPVNDARGHDVGDRVLIELSHRFVAAVRPGDTVARFGGDEFVVLCEDIDGPVQALVVAERLLDGARAPLVLEGRAVPTGVSVGIAVAAAAGETADSLITRADRAMYQAKRSGRGRAALAASEPPEVSP